MAEAATVSNDQFVHLHVHSEYSLLDGAARLKDLVKAAAGMGMKSLALTDHGVMYGVVDFYKMAKKAGIKPIIGCEVYVAPRSRFDKVAHVDSSPFHLLLLAENDQGYKNLVALVSQAFIDGFYYKPRLDKELLRSHSQGLIACSACLAGELPAAILSGDLDRARSVATEYRDIFGQGNFFLEMMNHGMPEQERVNSGLRQLSGELGIPLVVTNDCHYIRQEDDRVHDVLLCIQTGKTLQDENRMRFSTPEYYLKSAAEMAAVFPDDEEALRRTVEIAERCQVDFDFEHYHLPHYEVPEGYNLDTYLEKLCSEGLQRRYPEGIPEEAGKRIGYELQVIKQMGFSGYFLIVQDFINWSRSHGVLVGPGRGSAAGSVVAYSLGITDIDPLHYSLIFERFLNPNRVSMPDIDTDFDFEHRGRVIDYVVEKYGADHVAQIITFGTMLAKGAIRDVGRVLGMPLAKVDRIAKLVPEELGVTLEAAISSSPEMKQLYEEDSEVRQLLDLARAIEGMPRHSSTHAAGVVISREPLTEYLPVQKNGDMLVTQFTKETVEEIGLLKMDFLGLRTLTVIGDALQMIKETKGMEIKQEEIPLDDPKTFKLLGSGESAGIFQLESTGMRHILKNMKPSRFEDLIALVALYRPGPIVMVDDFISRKNGQTEVTYLHPVLEPILNETYGVILYQEQVMQISCDLAGFSMAQADSLRRAMGHKKPDEIAAMRDDFVKGAEERGVERKLASQIFDLMEKFAGYGFNKSHATAYAMIAYITAWLKANYPVALLAAMLTSFRSNTDKVCYYINECRRMGIEILPPDVNESLTNFTVVGDDKIRFGLAAVKNVGEGAVESMINARREGGPYLSLDDFCRRVDLRQVNKRVVESLVMCGAFDSLGGRRSQLLAVLDDCMETAQADRKDQDSQASGQVSLFDLLDEPQVRQVQRTLPEIPEFPQRELLAKEKEALGFYVSGHPLTDYQERLRGLATVEIGSLPQCRDGERVTIGGIVTSLRRSTSKNGNGVIHITIEDMSGSIDVTFYRLDNMQGLPLLQEDAILLVEGRLSVQEENCRLFGDDAKAFDPGSCQPETDQVLYLRLNPLAGNATTLERLRVLLMQSRGLTPVFLHLVAEGAIVAADASFTVEPCANLSYQLEEICGPGSCYLLPAESSWAKLLVSA